MNQTPQQVLDREFLGIRSRLLDLAAALDRVDRASRTPPAADPRIPDPRIDQIRRSLGVLAGGDPRRAEQVQQIFSLP